MHIYIAFESHYTEWSITGVHIYIAVESHYIQYYWSITGVRSTFEPVTKDDFGSCKLTE